MKLFQIAEEKRKQYYSISLQILLYVSALLLTLVFVEMAVAPGMFSFLRRISDVSAFAGMLAVFVSGVALIYYEQQTSKIMSLTYIVMLVISIFSMAFFVNCFVIGFLFSIPLVVASFVQPRAEKMKRIFRIFFFETFLVSNMSLFFNYTELGKTFGITYSLESSVIGEMALAIIALVVVKEWDKLPEDADLSHIRLCTLQKKCQKMLTLAGVLLAGALILGWDMGVSGDNVTITLQKADGGVHEAGILTNVLIKLFIGINHGFSNAIHNNIFAVINQRWGTVFVLIAFILLAYLTFILCRHLRFVQKKDAWDLAAVVGLLQLVILPVCIELIPLWCIFIFASAVRETGWMLHPFKFLKEKCMLLETRDS